MASEFRNFLDSDAVATRPLHGFSAAQNPVRNIGGLLVIPGSREHLNEALVNARDPVDIAKSDLDTVIPWPVADAPDGVGFARTPQRYIRNGETVTITIDGLGTSANTTRITHRH